MQGVTPQLDPRMSEDQISQKRLKALVQSLEWTYGVVWKLSSSDGLLEWVHGWFNPLSAESAQTLMPQFYSIFKDPCALGFSALALQRGSPVWWTFNMAEICTDKYKAQFLQEAHIQTVVCIPGLGADGMYCTELATTDLVPETDALMNSLQDYVSTSVKPHMLGVIESPLPSSLSPLNPGGQGDLSSDQFSSLGVTCPLNSGTPSAQITSPGSSGAGFNPSLNVNRYAPPGDFNECLGNSGTVLRDEEPYFLWTGPGNQSLFFDYGFPSGLFDEIDIDVDVEKTMFNSLESKKATKSSSNPDMMTSCKWDSDTLNSKEVELEAMTMPEFTASRVEHSSCKKSVSLPATNAQDLLDLLAGNKPCDPSATKSTSTVIRETDKQFSSFSHLLEASCSYSTPEAPLKTSDQATSSIDPFYLQQSTDISFIKNLVGQPNNVTNLLMDVHSCKPGLPASNFRHVHESLFKRRICSKLAVHGGDTRSSQQSLLRQWTEKIVPMIKEAQKLADQGLTRSCGTPSSGECERMPNPAHDEAAHVHKLAERSRRNNFNEKLHTLCTLIPIIKKKDRVSVLAHAIDYIHQLKTQVAHLEEAGGPLSKQGKGTDHSQSLASTISIQAQEDSTLDVSSSLGSVRKVAVCPDNDGVVINVEANNQTDTLIRVLMASSDLGLEVRSVNSTCINNEVHVAVNAVAGGVHGMSSMNVQEALQRVLIPSNTSLSTVTSDMDHLGDS